MKLRKLGGTLVLMILVAQSIFSYDLEINRTDLPYAGVFHESITGPVNGSVIPVYGEYVSGPGLVTFNDTEIDVEFNLDVPYEISDGGFLTSIILGNQTVPVTLHIMNDIDFFLDVSEGIYYPGDLIQIIPQAPVGSNIFINVTGPEHYIYNVTAPASISFVPQKSGRFDITVLFAYRNESIQMTKSVTITSVPTCSISVPAQSLPSKSILFSADVIGGTAPYIYLWDMGDGQSYTSIEPVHSYSAIADYGVNLAVTDSQGKTGQCTGSVLIEPEKYSLTIYLFDDIFGTEIGDANVTVNGETRKSNVNGRVQFTELLSQEHEIEIKKSGYNTYIEDYDLQNSTTIDINLSKTKEEDQPIPVIELLYPADSASLDNGNFEFRASSDTDMYECLLLINYIDHQGFKIMGTVSEPSGKAYTVQVNLTDGDYKWRVQCENEDGIGKSEDRNFTVTGSPEIVETVEKTAKKPAETQEQPFILPDLGRFDEDLSSIETLSKTIIQSAKPVQEAHNILGFKSLLEQNAKKIQDLKQSLINIAKLEISEIDRTRKKDEVLHDLSQLEATTPIELKIVESENYIQDNPEVSDAVSEYLTWKDINLSERQISRLTDRISKVQEEVIVRCDLTVLEAKMIDGSTQYYSIVKKDVSHNVTGGIFLELIPKTVAADIDELKFSSTYELVNRDPVVRIYVEENSEFTYYANKKIPIERLRQIGSVLVLDTSHPKNRITGFSILDTGQMTGQLFMIFILLSIVLTGNYFIFFRDQESRARFKSNVSRFISKIRPASRDQRLMQLLDAAIDLLNASDYSAFNYYGEIFDLYKRSSTNLQTELKPIICHLSSEMESYCLNKEIDEAYSMVIRGRSEEVVDTFYRIQSEIEALPEPCKGQVNKRFNKLKVSMQVYMLKNDIDDSDQSVEDNLFMVRQ